MASSVRLDDDFVQTAQVFAKVEKRSLTKQIEHWAMIGKIVEANPDLPYEFIRDSLVAMEEVTSGGAKPYVRRKQK